MKTILYDEQGKKKSDITLPVIFDTVVREDLSAKYFEVERIMAMKFESTFKEAGKRHSASGTISHRRHEWKGHYGKGISRAPRKTMWRRGTQFHWIGAEVSQTRGGRVAHPPLGLRRPRILNKKEISKAFASALAATMDPKKIAAHYPTLAQSNASSAAIESLPTKAKDFESTLKSIFVTAPNKITRKRSIRAGKGKSRNRKYKTSASILIVKSPTEKVKYTRTDIVDTKDLKIQDIYPLGRLTLYTKKALAELEKRK